MDIEYWTKYYEKHNIPFEASDFAHFVTKYMSEGESIIDLGCGNGRDTIFFNKVGLDSYGVDQCQNIVDGLNKEYGNNKLEFIVDDFTNMEWDETYLDNAYSRFTLHSIDEESEDRVIDWVRDHISSRFFIEVRSDQDSLVGKTTDHYRRFINFDNFLVKLVSNGFKIEYAELSKGFSKYNNKFGVDYNEDDPTLIRIVCKVR